MEATAAPTLTPAEKAKATKAARQAAREAAEVERRKARLAHYAEVSATWIPCPEPGCIVFPFETQADCDEHVASGAHTGTTQATAAGFIPGDEERPEAGEGHGSSAAPSNQATAKQVAFLARLLAELAELTGTEQAAPEHLSKSQASDRIENALEAIATAKAARPATEAPAPAHRPNKFAGRCATCGTTVEAGAGSLTGSRGNWITAHLPGECPTATAPAAPAEELTEGMYRTPAGELFKVQTSRESGRLYAKELTELDEPVVMGNGETKTHEFTYSSGALRKLTPAMKLTLEEAAAWGHATGSCCCCGRELRKAESIEAGIGPICASKF